MQPWRVRCAGSHPEPLRFAAWLTGASKWHVTVAKRAEAWARLRANATPWLCSHVTSSKLLSFSPCLSFFIYKMKDKSLYKLSSIKRRIVMISVLKGCYEDSMGEYVWNIFYNVWHVASLRKCLFNEQKRHSFQRGESSLHFKTERVWSQLLATMAKLLISLTRKGLGRWNQTILGPNSDKRQARGSLVHMHGTPVLSLTTASAETPGPTDKAELAFF